ncbi:MAG: 4Fe-4S dicluster domain-containing protein [Gaiellaceae bacterium]
MTIKVNGALLEDVRRHGSFEASACMNCGGCTAVCPLEINVLPRQVFRHVMLGMEEKLREETETIFSCLLCGLCEATCCCATETHITENIRSLRSYLNRKEFGL